MRADAAGAKTWLIGVLALWALVFWILALAGLGTRIERLPSDPSLLQPLPSPPAPVQERLGPFPQYAAVGDRPLFTDDRRPQPFFINPESTPEQATFDYVLTSVLVSPGLQMAILRGTGGGEPIRLRVGESPEATPSWSLQSVQPRSVVFVGPEGTRTLELRVFDGVGGEAPTVLAPRPTGPVVGSQPQPTGAPAASVAARNGEQRAPPVAPPAPQPVPVQAEGPPLTPDAQVEAIRQRIEARRAQLRQQAQQPQQPPQPTPAPAPDESL
ncbi:MAG: general secretion pathway protein GspN [Pseudomonadota bacterium]|nr:general secretion pathway protein GspN [Pseudomonadota bacterium]